MQAKRRTFKTQIVQKSIKKTEMLNRNILNVLAIITSLLFLQHDNQIHEMDYQRYFNLKVQALQTLRQDPP